MIEKTRGMIDQTEVMTKKIREMIPQTRVVIKKKRGIIAQDGAVVEKNRGMIPQAGVMIEKIGRMIPKTEVVVEISDILKYMMEFYNRVLVDEQTVTSVSRYAITKEDLEKGRQKIVEADTAKTTHNVEMGEAQDATDRRDKAFNQLLYIIEELETICTYALEDRPQLLEKLGITVLSEGYKRKNKETEEPQDNPE